MGEGPLSGLVRFVVRHGVLIALTATGVVIGLQVRP
jgi:hypothetical protein